MPGSSNFLQFNPPAANQETDVQYAADSLRAGGAPTNAIFASPLANKAFYQWSTFVCALAASMAIKGYVLSDANLTTLTTVLGNLITQADIPNLFLEQAVYRNGVFVPLTGTLTRTNMFTAGVAASQIRNNSVIRVTVRFRLISFSGTVNVWVNLSGVGTFINLNPGETELVYDFVMNGVLTDEKKYVKITPTGVVTTLASQGVQGVDLTAGGNVSLDAQLSNTSDQFVLESVLAQLL